jgi:hypothetical protein
LLASILLRTAVIKSGRNDEDERYGSSADPEALPPVSAEEMNRFFHTERDIVVFQFFAGKMTGHENLWMGLKFYVNTFNDLGFFRTPRNLVESRVVEEQHRGIEKCSKQKRNSPSPRSDRIATPAAT